MRWVLLLFLEIGGAEGIEPLTSSLSVLSVLFRFLLPS